MRIVALLAIRNEELYLERCIEHLISQGIEICIIDNDSTDHSLQIARSHLGAGVCCIERLPYQGFFDERAKMSLKAKLAQEIKADWFIHHDADEIRESPQPYQTLLQGIMEVDRQGYNAVNFDEFVFLPTDKSEAYEGKDYVSHMKHYYFLEPRKLNRINAWKKTTLDERFVDSGGHHIVFDNINVYPEAFVLRHYIGLSWRHLLSKYTSRVHSMEEVLSLSMNKKRAMFTPDQLQLPNREELKQVDPAGYWDRTDPWRAHKFLGDNKSTSNIYQMVKRPIKRVSKAIDSEAGLIDCSPVAVITSVDKVAASLLAEMLKKAADVTLLELGEGTNKTATEVENSLTERMRDDENTAQWGVVILPEDLFRLLEIEKLLPKSCFIHVIQDGRRLLVSRYPDSEQQIANVEQEAIHWTWGIREARQQSQLLSCYMEVKLEALVQNPETVIEGILEKLDWSTSEESVQEQLHAVRDRWLESNTIWRQPVAMEKGVAGVNAQALADYESIAGAILREVGYSGDD